MASVPLPGRSRPVSASAADRSALPQVDCCPMTFWLIGASLVAYVALCTGFRDNNWGADAWEHDRVVRALAEQLWRPGNPTYATDEPSVRYAPYTLALALVCRISAAHSYSVMSGAAVVNTALLIAALYVLLRVYNMRRAGAYVLVLTVGLYGTIPGHANSLALADLPTQQVNPSAFGLPCVLLAWAIFEASAQRERAWAAVVIATLLGTITMLSHSLTGVFGYLGLLVLVVLAPRRRWFILGKRFAAVATATFLLCAVWPWFDFIEAVTTRRDNLYWFNPGILKLMFTHWGAPGLLLAVAGVSLRANPLVRLSLATGGLCFGLGLVAFAAKSPILERLPLPALLLLQIAAAIWMFDCGLLRPATWPARIRCLLSTRSSSAPNAALEVIAGIILVYCVLPQCYAVVRSPSLARVYVAPVLGRQDKQVNVRARLQAVLQPVGRKDVVLSDILTSWPVPSFAGRIVAGLHYELFTPDQPQREADLDAFFAVDNDRERRHILDKYSVRWILLNRERLSPETVGNLLEPQAVVREFDAFLLMDAARWRLLRQSRTQSQVATHRTERGVP